MNIISLKIANLHPTGWWLQCTLHFISSQVLSLEKKNGDHIKQQTIVVVAWNTGIGLMYKSSKNMTQCFTQKALHKVGCCSFHNLKEALTTFIRGKNKTPGREKKGTSTRAFHPIKAVRMSLFLFLGGRRNSSCPWVHCSEKPWFLLNRHFLPLCESILWLAWKQREGQEAGWFGNSKKSDWLNTINILWSCPSWSSLQLKCFVCKASKRFAIRLRKCSFNWM